MSLSKHKKMPSYDFPDEILSEIFKRLPVKYVLRCGCVQKSWYYLVKTPIFIALHFNYQKLTAHINPKYLLFHDTNTHVMTLRSDDAQCRKYCTLFYPTDLPETSWSAQANGLMCASNMLDSDNPDIYIWNPLVQKIKKVPDSPLSTFTVKETKWNALAFGFLPEVNDYVVVHIVKPCSTCEPYSFDYLDLNPPVAYEEFPHSVVIGVYSMNTNSWKKICQDKVFVDRMCVDHAVFVNSTAFWVGFSSDESEQLVMYFDTKTNILRRIMMPPWVVLHERQLESPHILPFGQSIAYFVEVDEEDVDEDDEDYGYSHLDIWEFKDGMMGDFSWDKKIEVILGENVLAEILGIRNNGEPIQSKSNKLISYDLRTYKPYDFVESWDRLTPYPSYKEGSKAPFVISPFVETLVLLDYD